MLIALLLAAGGAFVLSRMSGKSPASLIIIFLLMGMAWFVFTQVQGKVLGGLSKGVGA